MEVRILIPERSDNPLVDLSAWSYIDELEKAGIAVYRYQHGFMHQKVTLIDDDYATIGTANFDNRSFRLNFEITMAVADREVATHVRHAGERFCALAARHRGRPALAPAGVPLRRPRGATYGAGAVKGSQLSAVSCQPGWRYRL